MDVIYIDFNHPSFNWGNGLYIVIKTNDNDYELCKLDDDGQPQLYDDGRFMITVVGKGNKGIVKTNLKYFTEKQLRTEKLKKISKKNNI